MGELGGILQTWIAKSDVWNCALSPLGADSSTQDKCENTYLRKIEDEAIKRSSLQEIQVFVY